MMKMRRSALVLFSVFIGGCPSKPPPPVKKPQPVVVAAKPSAAVVTVPQPPPPPPPPPLPTPAEHLAAFLKNLAPIDMPETLLIGVETVPSVGYGPLYGEGPQATPEDKLHTLVIHVHDGKAELAGELPFLAIPQEKGFLYMGVASYGRDDTEAERVRQGEKFGMDDEYGSKVYWYSGSSLWRTKDRAKVDAERTRERKRIEKKRKYGILFGEDINYVTSQAMCSTSYDAEWTGGALAFMAHESQSLTGLTKKVPQLLSKYANDAGISQFATDILNQREPGEDHADVSLDEPYDMGWSKVSWRKDSRVCLARTDGRVTLTGVIRLPNNSARSSEWEAPVRDAPAELASNSTPPLALADIKEAFAVPKPVDAIVSPRKTILVSQFQNGFSVYGAKSSIPLLFIPLAGRIVMAEWANGERATTWATVGEPSKLTAQTACACDVGMMCFESKCVKPKTVFVTSTVYSGNLEGLAGADAKCQARAKAAGLGGDFKAWLSDSNVSAAERLTHAQVPYVLVDGTILAKDWAELTKGELRAPIYLTEFGKSPTIVPHPPGCGDSLVWTNTTENGSMGAKTRSCSDWTDGTSKPSKDKGAIWGQTDSESLWSSECKSEYIGCNGSFPIFCLEQ